MRSQEFKSQDRSLQARAVLPSNPRSLRSLTTEFYFFEEILHLIEIDHSNGIVTWCRIQQVVGGNRRLVARPDASAPAQSQILLSSKQRQRLPSAEMPEKLWGQLMQ